FNGEWLENNLKFDVSLSSGPNAAGSARFSYNNFGERDGFRGKIARVFALYPGVYDETVLHAVLDLMEPTNERHQTTLGFEWTGAEAPRIKVYFEELQHGYS